MIGCSQVGRGLRPRCGSILMETVLVMPILLFLIFGIIQFAQIWMARQLVVYAASCAARAMTVVHQDEQAEAADKAAKVALSWLCFAETQAEEKARTDGTAGVQIPGWGSVPGSGSVSRRVTTRVLWDGTDEPSVGVAVDFRFPLLIPGMAINVILGNAVNASNRTVPASSDFYGNLAQASANPIVDIDGWPYIGLRETCVLPMPYSPKNLPKGGFAGCKINGFALTGNRSE